MLTAELAHPCCPMSPWFTPIRGIYAVQSCRKLEKEPFSCMISHYLLKKKKHKVCTEHPPTAEKQQYWQTNMQTFQCALFSQGGHLLREFLPSYVHCLHFLQLIFWIVFFFTKKRGIWPSMSCICSSVKIHFYKYYSFWHIWNKKLNIWIIFYVFLLLLFFF